MSALPESHPATLRAARRKLPGRLSAAARYRLISLASPVLLLILWEVLVRTGVLDARFFPAPSKISETFFALVQDGSLWVNTWASLQRLFWGFLLGAIPALLLGIAMGLSRPLRAFVNPIVSTTYPVPKSAIFPLILLIFGLGESSKIVMVAIGVFYPVLINS